MLRLDTGGAEHIKPAASFGIRIERTRNHLRHSGGEHRFRARRRRAVMRARLHRHEEHRSLRALAGRVERDHLGMRLALALVPALTHDLAVVDDDRAYDRVRIRGAAAALRELE